MSGLPGPPAVPWQPGWHKFAAMPGIPGSHGLPGFSGSAGLVPGMAYQPYKPLPEAARLPHPPDHRPVFYNEGGAYNFLRE